MYPDEGKSVVNGYDTRPANKYPDTEAPTAPITEQLRELHRSARTAEERDMMRQKELADVYARIARLEAIIGV